MARQPSAPTAEPGPQTGAAGAPPERASDTAMPAVTPSVHPALAEHAARYSPKIVQTGARTHTFIGYNIANVSIIEAPDGLILVDGMAQENHARQALADIQTRFPGQAIKAVVYTHFHNDHVNGIEGFIDAAEVEAGRIEVWAHQDLMHFVTEVSAGTGPIMGRRAGYTFGAGLPRGPEGFVHAGLGLPHDPGPRGFIAPTHSVSQRQSVRLAGLEVELIPIPSETDDMLGLFLPDEEIFLTGDCIQGECYPNIYTLRGTPYRDPMQWVATIDWIRHSLKPRAIVPHHGHPLTHEAEIDHVLTAYRDAIQFTHDQALRYMNKGLKPAAIALKVQMPAHLADHPWLGEFYGTLKHCIPAIYGGKLGWFSGDPVDLDPMPEAERAQRYVSLMGGPDAVCRAAEAAMAEGAFLWAAELLAFLVTLHPEDAALCRARARALRAWSYAQSNPNWRNWGLSCALELDPPPQSDQAKQQLVMAPPAVIKAFPPANILRAMATRVKAEAVGELHICVGFEISDKGLYHALELRRGVVEFHEDAAQTASPDVSLRFSSDFFSDLIEQKDRWPDAIQSGRIALSGDRDKLKAFFGAFEPPTKPQDIFMVRPPVPA